MKTTEQLKLTIMGIISQGSPKIILPVKETWYINWE